MIKKTIIGLLAVSVIVSLVGCNNSNQSNSNSKSSDVVTSITASKSSKKEGFVIGFSNGYFGNTWRSQLVENFETSAKSYKDQGIIKDYIVSNTKSDPTEQNNQINAMIDAGVDALMIDAAAPNSIKSVVDKALEAGILVVITNDPAAYKNTIAVCGNNTTWQEIQTKWLVEKLNGKGDIVEITGEPGNAADTLRQDANKKILKDYPDIKVMTSVPGKWSQTEAQSVMTTILSSYDKIDAVLTQDVMGEGIIKAYESAGKELPIMTGDYTKSFLQKWSKNPNLDSIGVPYAPGISATALDITIKLLQGKTLKDEYLKPNPMDESLVNTILVDPPYVVTKEGDQNASWMNGLVGTKAITLDEALKIMNDLPETAALDGHLSMEEVDTFFK